MESYSNEIVIHALLRLMNAGIRSNNVSAISQATKRLLKEINTNPENLQDEATTYSEIIGPFWFSDGEFAGIQPFYFDYSEDLLDQAVSDDELGLILWFLVLREITLDDESDHRSGRILRAASLLQHPAFDSVLVEQGYIKQNPIPWRLVGEAWTRSSLYSLRLYSSGAIHNSPLDWVDKYTKKAVTDFAKGMLVILNNVEQVSSGAREIFFVGIRQQLLDREMDNLFLKISRAIEKLDPCQSTWFDYALGEHKAGDKLIAIGLYWKVLESDKLHFSALFNLLLIYSSYPSVEDIKKISHIIENASETDFSYDQRKQLEGVLSQAREALKPSPAVIRATAIERELLEWGKVIDVCPDIEDINFDEALALLILLRVSTSISETYILESIDKGILPFSPTSYHRKLLFRLLHVHYIAFDCSSPPAAFVVDGEEVVSYYFGQMRWKVSEAVILLSKKIEQVARSKDWPRTWYARVQELSKELAIQECIAYFNHLADERNFPDPDPEKARLLFEGLLVDYSVSQCYYFSYLAALAASDYKQKLPVNAAQAANVMILRCQQKADRARNEKWEVKRYSRPRDVARSSMSEVLHDIFTSLGEIAFSEPLAKLQFPRPE